MFFKNRVKTAYIWGHGFKGGGGAWALTPMKPPLFYHLKHMELKKQRKPGSGRKPIDKGLRKVPVTVFLENRVIDAVGGQAKVKAAFVDFISSIYQSMHHAKTNPTNHRPAPDRILP